jgi:hypothetical protein
MKIETSGELGLCHGLLRNPAHPPLPVLATPPELAKHRIDMIAKALGE